MRVAIYFSPECANADSPRPLPESTYAFEWTAPPEILYPGQPFDFVLKASLVGNTQPANTYRGYICAALQGFETPPAERKCGGLQWAKFQRNPRYAGESDVWNNLQRNAAEQLVGPPVWWGTDARCPSPGLEIRVTFAVGSSSTYWTSYVYRLVDGTGPEPPPPTQAPLPPTPVPAELGDLWRIRESSPQGEGCDGVWQRRPGTRTFDARWQCVGGPVVDVVRIESVSGDQVVVYREGISGRYHLTRSPDRRLILSARIDWAADWSFAGTIEQRG